MFTCHLRLVRNLNFAHDLCCARTIDRTLIDVFPCAVVPPPPSRLSFFFSVSVFSLSFSLFFCLCLSLVSVSVPAPISLPLCCCRYCCRCHCCCCCCRCCFQKIDVSDPENPPTDEKVVLDITGSDNIRLDTEEVRAVFLFLAMSGEKLCTTALQEKMRSPLLTLRSRPWPTPANASPWRALFLTRTG